MTNRPDKESNEMSAVAEKKKVQMNSNGHYRGGAREGAGRPPGHTNKYSTQTMLAAIEATVGKPFSESMAEGYRNAIDDGDTKLRWAYEKMILDKVVADRVAVEVSDGDTLEAKMEAFHRALQGANTVQLTVQPTVGPTLQPSVQPPQS